MKQVGVLVSFSGVQKDALKRYPKVGVARFVVRRLGEGCGFMKKLVDLSATKAGSAQPTCCSCECCGKELGVSPEWFVVSYHKSEFADSFLTTPCGTFTEATQVETRLRVSGAKKTNIVSAETLERAKNEKTIEKTMERLGL